MTSIRLIFRRSLCLGAGLLHIAAASLLLAGGGTARRAEYGDAEFTSAATQFTPSKQEGYAK